MIQSFADFADVQAAQAAWSESGTVPQRGAIIPSGISETGIG
jgi:hypothetical protein